MLGEQLYGEHAAKLMAMISGTLEVEANTAVLGVTNQQFHGM